MLHEILPPRCSGPSLLLLLLLTRNMQGPSLYTSFFPYLRTLMQKAFTRKLHLQHTKQVPEQVAAGANCT
jgi:hypothetical protein